MELLPANHVFYFYATKQAGTTVNRASFHETASLTFDIAPEHHASPLVKLEMPRQSRMLRSVSSLIVTRQLELQQPPPVCRLTE